MHVYRYKFCFKLLVSKTSVAYCELLIYTKYTMLEKLHSIKNIANVYKNCSY